jgi:hypothetical protein
MPTYDGGFQLGLLPEKKWNWRTFAASYGILAALILLLIVVGIMTSDTLLSAVNYHVTELVPRRRCEAGAAAQAKAAAGARQVAAAANRCSRSRS